MKTPILGGYAVARSVNAADNRLMNLYPEATPEGGKSSGFLTRCPGYKYLMDVGSGPIRGLWQFANTMYVVSGVELYRVTPGFVATLIGSVSGAGPVSMSDNGEQLFVACNPRSYTYNFNTGAFAEITDPDFPGAVTVGFINGYFVFNEPNSQKVWITEYQNGAAIDPLEFSFTDANPDLLISLMVNRNEIWMFGTTSTEVWYYSGDVDFPLARIQGAFNEIGCAAPYSPAKLDNTVFWLGSDPRGNAMVYKAVGYGAQRVSTHGIEKVLQSYTYVGDAIGYSYQQEGHTFYVLTFPSANATWVFDAATNEWHERGSWKQGHYNRHRSNCQVNFNNKIILGDFQYGKLYEFDLEYYQDDVGTQRWVRSWRALPPNANNLNRTAHHSLQVELEAGNTEYVTVIPANPGSPGVPAMVTVTLDPYKSNLSGSLSGGNLTYSWGLPGATGCSFGTVGRNTGKFYFEVVNTLPGGYGGAIYENWSFNAGIAATRNTANDIYAGISADSWGFSNSNGSGLTTETTLFNNATPTTLSVSQIPQDGYLGVAVDLDAGKVWFKANGSWVLSGDPAAGTNPAYTFTANTVVYPVIGQGSHTPGGVSTANFGATAFLGTVPTGFLGWNIGGTTNTFDLVDSNNTLTFTNGDLTVQGTDTLLPLGEFYGAISTVSHNTGKKYLEFTQDVWVTKSVEAGLVVSKADMGMPSSNYIGYTASGYGVDFDWAGTCFALNNSTSSTLGTGLTANGDIIGIAVDFDAGKWWVSRNGNFGVGNDPATGTGGTAFPFTPNTTLYAAIALNGNVAQITANLGASDFEYTVPAGFSSWEIPVSPPIPPVPPTPGEVIKRYPKVLLRWSDDGGHTWSNYYDKNLGAVGEYWHRVIWRRLGMTTKLRDRVYELSGADPVKITLTGAELMLSGTNS